MTIINKSLGAPTNLKQSSSRSYQTFQNNMTPLLSALKESLKTDYTKNIDATVAKSSKQQKGVLERNRSRAGYSNSIPTALREAEERRSNLADPLEIASLTNTENYNRFDQRSSIYGELGGLGNLYKDSAQKGFAGVEGSNSQEKANKAQFDAAQDAQQAQQWAAVAAIGLALL